MRKSLDLLAVDRVRLSRAKALTELRGDILRASYIEGDFVLSDGLRRKYYFDKYLFETRPALLRRVARFLGELVPRDTDRLAAPALGAVMLGTAVSLDVGLPLVIVKSDVDSDPEHAVKGELFMAETVTLLEDVVMTGTRALTAVSRIEEAGAKVRTVVAVMDRGEGAIDRFSNASIDYIYLFEPGELEVAEHVGRHVPAPPPVDGP